MKKANDINRWPVKSYFVFLSVCAFAVLILMPGLVGALVEELALTATEAGQVGAANLAGIALLSFIGFLSVDRWALRWTTAVGSLLMLAAQLISAQTTDLAGLIVLQFTAGIGGGLLIVSGLAILGGMKNPDSMASLMLVGQLGFGVLAYQVLGLVLKVFSVAGVFVGLGLLTLPLLLFVFLMPVRSFADSHQREGKPLLKLLSLGAILILIAEMLLYSANTAIYAYTDRIGAAGGLAMDVINEALSLTNLAAMLAGLSVAYLGTRLGRRLPIMAALMVMVMAFGGLHLFVTEWQFKVLSCFVLISLCVAMPYVIGLLVELDPSGRLASLSNCVVATGAGLGPYVGGLLLEGGQEFFLLIAASVATVLMTLLLVVLALRAVNRATAVVNQEALSL